MFKDDLEKGRRFNEQAQNILGEFYQVSPKCMVFTEEKANPENGILDIDIIGLDGEENFKAISLKTREFYNFNEDFTVEFEEKGSKGAFFDGKPDIYLFIRSKAENPNEISYAYIIDRYVLLNAWKAGKIKGKVIKSGTGSFISFSYKELKESEALLFKTRAADIAKYKQLDFISNPIKLYKLISYLRRLN